MIDRRLIQNFDWVLLFAVILITACGLLNLYSALSTVGGIKKAMFYRQVHSLILGFILLFAAILFDYSHLERGAPFFFGACLLLLVVTLILGKAAGGSRRWLSVGRFVFQPSELMKLGLIFYLAKHLGQGVPKGGLRLKELAVPAAVLVAAMVLVVRQPDLGTTLLFMLIAGSMLVFAGVQTQALVLLAGLGLSFMPIVFFFLKDYQKERILTLIDPGRDPLGAGYHLIQSKIAVGSGGFWGKGFLKGTQSHLKFLPEHHTDFIFSLLAEEWGFVGGMVILALFFLLIISCLNTARKARDPFGSFVAVGVASMVFWQVFINIGMVLGLLPVVGIPLPLISFGGSSATVTLMGLGLVLNIGMRKFIFRRK